MGSGKENSCNEHYVYSELSASEAIAKIKDFEEQKKAEETGLKVGTRVRTTKDKDYDGFEVFPVGTVGIIEKIDTLDKLPYKISANDDYWYYSRDMFEVIDDEIIVGDEVIHISINCIGVVSKVSEKNLCIVWDDGNVGYFGKNIVKKTGRHFDKIPDVLKQLQEGE